MKNHDSELLVKLLILYIFIVVYCFHFPPSYVLINFDNKIAATASSDSEDEMSSKTEANTGKESTGANKAVSEAPHWF